MPLALRRFLSASSPDLWRLLLLVLLFFFFGPQLRGDPLPRFFAMGDVPYSESETRLLDVLLQQELDADTRFAVHVGDIKAGGAPCTDEAIAGIAALFSRLPVPLVYTPGDNDWTDCRRASAGGHDPGERLDALRRLFFGDPAVLRLDRLAVRRDEPAYPENYYFLQGDLLVATFHLVGSSDNRRPGDPDAIAEHEARTAANRRHWSRVLAAARASGARALVAVLHANPLLESPAPPPAYRPLREDLLGFLAGFDGPVLLIHGDTHRFRFDHPLRDPLSGRTLERLTRLEVPGSPQVGGVWVTLDPGGEQPFRVAPVYLNARDLLLEE